MAPLILGFDTRKRKDERDGNAVAKGILAGVFRVHNRAKAEACTGGRRRTPPAPSPGKRGTDLITLDRAHRRWPRGSRRCLVRRWGRALARLGMVGFLSLRVMDGGAAASAPREVSPGDDRADQVRNDRGLRTLTQRRVVIEGDGSIGPYATGETFLLVDSEEVWRGERRLVRDLDYRLDETNGTLILSQPLLRGQTLEIRCEVLPLRLSRDYFHRRPAPARPRVAEATSPSLTGPGGPGEGTTPAGSASRGGPGTRPGSGMEPAASLAGLVVGGSKTVSFGVGSGRDLALDQELNLSIAGRLTPDVEVKALLSDRNLPLQPEGTTRELDRLDQIRVEVRGPRAEVGLGDYEVRLAGESEFVPVERELQGVQAKVGSEESALHAGVAVAKGRFRRQEFMGVEGRQGPYLLTDANGAEDIVVLAGSETVWLDGQRVVRGEENDYIIDYSRGRLEFTRRHLITAESRLAVDFEFANEAYRRSLIFSTAQREAFEGRLRVGGLLLHEGDNWKESLGSPLSHDQQELLAAAGDADSLALAPGWTHVGEGKGDYVIQAPSAGEQDSLLVYVGDGQGSVQARFTRVEAGRGSYVRKYDDARLRYYFEHQPPGDSLGDYIPRIRLARPRAHTVADLRWELDPARNFYLTGELAGSREDRNLLSPLQDWDNDDRALALRAELRDAPLGRGDHSWGRLSVQGRWRNVGPNFAAPGVNVPAFYGADWNLQGGRADAAGLGGAGEELMREVRAQYAPLARLVLRGGKGTLRRGPELHARRWEAGGETSWPPGGKLSLDRSDVTTDRADTTSTARVTRAAIERQWRALFAQAETTHDEREDRAASETRRGFAFREYTGHLGIGSPGETRMEGDVRARRNREVRAGAWQPQSTSREGALALYWRRGSGLVSARLARRTLDVDPGAEGADSRSDLAEIILRDLIPPQSLSTETTYRITNTEDDTQERRFVRVGPGADYDSAGTYMPGEGEFAPVRVSTGLLPVTAVEFTSRLRWSAHRRERQEGAAERERTSDEVARGAEPREAEPREAERGGARAFFRGIGGESYLTVEERSRAEDRLSLYLLRPRVLQKEATTLFGRIIWRQDLMFREGEGPLSARLRLGYRQEMDNRVVNHVVGRRETEQEVRLRSAPRPGLTLEGKLRRRQSHASAEGGSHSGPEELTIYEAGFSASHQRTMAVGLKFEANVASDRDRVSGRRFREIELAPGASYALAGRGRLEARLVWRTSEGAGEALPVSGLGLVRRGGWEWRLTADYRVSKYVQGTFRIDGQDLQGRKVEHRGTAELRAYF